MLARELKSHFIVTIIWLLAVSILNYNFHLPVQDQLFNFILLWFGGMLGTMILDLDQFVYVLFSHPEEYSSLRIKRTLNLGNIKETLALLADTAGERQKLVFHSVLFHIVLVIMCFFVLSSAANIFGKGLVMAMFLHLLKDEVDLIRNGNEEFLRKLLFWQIKTEISFKNQKYFVFGSVFIFVFFSLFLI